MKNAAAIVALASCLSIAAHADSTPQVPEGFVACSKIQDAAERVRCYDAQVAAMKNAAGGTAAAAASSSAAPASPAAPAAPSAAGTNAGSVAPAPAPAAPARPAAARDSATHFGEEELPPSRQPKRSHEQDTLSSSIAGVDKGPAGIYYFSLANGQVWRADGSTIALDATIPIVFRVGVPIRIERGSLGSYHMWAPAVGAKNWMYVRRLR